MLLVHSDIGKKLEKRTGPSSLAPVRTKVPLSLGMFSTSGCYHEFIWRGVTAIHVGSPSTEAIYFMWKTLMYRRFPT